MEDFYHPLSAKDRAKQTTSQFNRERTQLAKRRRQAERDQAADTHKETTEIHPDESTFGLITQNVNGFGRTDADRDAWFKSFRTTDAHGRQDVVLLQETHVEPTEVRGAEYGHASRWGFRTGDGCRRLSYWAPSSGNKGGVGVLVNPYGGFSNVTPYAEAEWSPHFMAVTGEMEGQQLIVVNIYAPHTPAQRERFFRKLISLRFPVGVRVAVGGDFNCTLDAQADRSHARTGSQHVSSALTEVISHWGLIDPVALSRPARWSEAALLRHQQETHTYHYTAPDTGMASSRLDRWYVTPTALEWVASSEAFVAGARSDHKGVRLHLVSPGDPVRIRKPARVFPVPQYAEVAVRKTTRELIQRLAERLRDETNSPSEWATIWEEFKVEIVKATLRVKKERRKTVRGGLQQKLKRLLKQHQRHQEEDRGVRTDVASLTDLFEALSFEDVGGPNRAARLRRAISDCKRDLAAFKQRRNFQEGAHCMGKTTKNLFKRVSSKFQDNTIRRLDPVEGAPPRGVHDKPDIFGDAWTPVLQQPSTPPDKVDEVAGWMHPNESPSAAQQGVARPITESEVRAAIQACKVGKATGPDRIGNDWYRAHAEEIAPVLTTLLDLWYEAGSFPASFLDADIFCLKKAGKSSNALNFRPLALLNTDYKVFTRILATRVSPTLADRIHPNQNGFVPGRTIHETLHLFEAAQKMVLVDSEQADALTMLLDFKKAYDSLDRQYMIRVLRQHGYPEKFVTAVLRLHEGTRVQFLANGSKSRWISVTSGIRQGCPLAPLLFILALEPLYRKLDSDTQLAGVVIQSEAGKLELRVAGYADDTAVYLRSPADTKRLQEITTTFGQASGLQLNEGKTLVIALNPSGPRPGVTLPPPLQYQAHGVAGRYLGIQVGSGVPPERTWEVADAQLRVRLTLASQKPLTVDQRSLIAAAVIIPKLTYIAQHAWPTVASINQFSKKLKNYVWHATFAAEMEGSRAWLDADLASLDRTSGGLALPDLRAELMAMAATTVSRWAATGTAALHIAGDVLFAKAGLGKIPKTQVTPNSLPPPDRGCRMQHSMWTTGRTLVTCAGGVAPHLQRSKMVTALRSLGLDFGLLSITFEGDAYRVDGMGLLGSVYEQARHQLTATEGKRCLEWLPEAGLAELYLHHEGGRLLPARTEVPMGPTSGPIARVVTWTLERRGVLWFHPSRPRWRGDGAGGNWLGSFITVLVTNFPELLAQSSYRDEVRIVASPADHSITAHVTTNRDLIITTSATSSDTLSDVSGQLAMETALVRTAGSEVKILHVHAHPSLSRRVSLTLEGRRRPYPRKHYKHYVRHAGIHRGLGVQAARAAKWKESSDPAATGLAQLEWKRIRRVLGLGAWGEQVLYRLKARAFSLYDVRNEKLGCPHESCVHEREVTIHHVFWTCPAARQLRQLFLAPWLRVGLARASTELACFSLELTAVPPAFWELAASSDMPNGTHDALLDVNITAMVEGCWRLGAALYFHAVWRWRVQHFDDTNDVSANRQKLLLASRLRQGYSNMHLYVDPTGQRRLLASAAGIVRQALRMPWQGSHQAASTTEMPGCYLLFFDGGSRGNPGPGGSGAIVVRWLNTGGDYQLVWAGSMSYAATTTTNNVAEYMGLITGLTACCQQGFSPLNVIGDSELIIRQQLTRKAPKAKHLKPLYWRCRRLLSGVRVLTWQHHLREHNKMADLLANQAMDTLTSKQSRLDPNVLQTARWSALAANAGGDIGQWALNNAIADSEGAAVLAP